MPPEPRTPRHQYLSRDQRLQVQTLHLARHTHAFIASQLGITLRQVAYAIACERVTPTHRSGRPPRLTNAQVDELEAFVRLSRENRQLSFQQLSDTFDAWQVGQYTIRNALRNRGYSRHVARAKPHLSDETRRARLEWATAHADWTAEQWSAILWSGETWVTGWRRQRKQWVTRKSDEELDDTCLVDGIRSDRSCMFWGCFSGARKGPCLVWEREWGAVNPESYGERIVPLVDGWMRLHAGLSFMLDGGAGQYAINELQLRDIETVVWPACSPDLNPIATVWGTMEDWMGEKYPELCVGKQCAYDRLRVGVEEAWDAVLVDQLKELVRSMPKRCRAVIEAQGGHTAY